MPYELTWDEVNEAADKCAARWQGRNIERVWGVPNGGTIPAMLVADLLGVELLPAHSTPDVGTLIVDDLVDSGQTARRVAHTHAFDALFRKSAAPVDLAPDAVLFDQATWLVFPWEHADDTTGPADAVVRLLNYIGEDPNRDGLVDTPARVLKALRELTSGYQQDPAVILDRTFDVAHDQLILVKDIGFHSLCEHHMLPFVGKAHVAYLPNAELGKVVGLSKIARLVEAFARRLQVQERLTNQIAHAIQEHLHPLGVGVIITAHHSCMGARGISKPEATMTTSCLLGVLRYSDAARNEFLDLAR